MFFSKQFIKSFFLATLCFSILSISIVNNEINKSVKILTEIPGNYSTISLFAYCFIFYTIFRRYKISKYIYPIAALIAIIILIGDSFYNFNSFIGITSNFKTILIFTGKLLALTYLISCVIVIIMDKIKKNTGIIEEQKISFWKIFGIILLFWLPFFIIFFPGTPTWDGLTMLNSGYGIWPPSDHHPYLLSVFFAKIISLRKYIGDFFAFGVLTLILFLFQLVNYSFSCYILCKVNNRNRAFPWYFPPLFIGIVPLFPLYGQSIMKDGPYASCFVLFCSLLFFILFTKNSLSNWKTWLLLLYSTITLCIIRHNGLYVVAPTLTLLLFYFLLINSKEFKPTCLILITAISFVSFVHFSLYPNLTVKPAAKRETFGIMGQMVGRAISENLTKLSSSQAENIKKIIPEYEKIPLEYNPELYDPIKHLINKNASAKDLLILTKNLCTSYPKSCLKGLINHIYLYFYPFANNRVMAPFYYWIETGAPNTNYFKLQYFFKDGLRNLLVKYSYYWINNLPLSLLSRPSLTSFLCLLVFILAFINKNIRIFLISFPISISLMINLLSPVNGDFRYALPILSCFPLLIILLLILIQTNQSSLEKFKQSQP